MIVCSEEAKASIRGLRQRLDYWADETAGLVTQRLQESRDRISENPLLAVGTAFGLGVVLATLCDR